MAVVFLGRRSVANTNANGEHQTPSWTPSQGMSIRTLSIAKIHESETQFVDESRLFWYRTTLPRLNCHQKQPSKNNKSNRQN
jgi:hypothetical protein